MTATDNTTISTHTATPTRKIQRLSQGCLFVRVNASCRTWMSHDQTKRSSKSVPAVAGDNYSLHITLG